MNFKQTITINNILYEAVLTKNFNPYDDTLTYNFVISGEGREYRTTLSYDEQQIDRLIHGLRLELGMNYNVMFEYNEAVLLCEITHPSIPFNETYVLDIVPRDTSIISQLQVSINEILNETVSKTYHLTKLGPCISSSPDSMSINMVRETVSNLIEYLKVNNAKKNNIVELPYMIKDFYDIEILYQDNAPTITETQLVFHGAIYFDKFNINYKHFSNTYTVLSLKNSCHGSVGFITKKKDEIQIELGKNTSKFQFVASCPLPATKTSSNTSGDIIHHYNKDIFLKYGYILELPFSVKDGIYTGFDGINNSLHWILILNNYVYYHLNYLQGDTFTINSKDFHIYNKMTIKL